MSESRSVGGQLSRVGRQTNLSASLSKFLKENRARYPSMTAFAKGAGLSRHTIMQICDGRLTSLTNRTRSAIFAATGLEAFAPFPEPPPDNSASPARSSRSAPFSAELARLRTATDEILQTLTRLQSVPMGDLGVPPRAPTGLSAAQRIERVRQVLTALDQELAFFKQVDRSQARELLRSRIDPRDVGYIIAILRALYSDEAFDSWVLASGYGLRKTTETE